MCLTACSAKMILFSHNCRPIWEGQQNATIISVATRNFGWKFSVSRKKIRHACSIFVKGPKIGNICWCKVLSGIAAFWNKKGCEDTDKTTRFQAWMNSNSKTALKKLFTKFHFIRKLFIFFRHFSNWTQCKFSLGFLNHLLNDLSYF